MQTMVPMITDKQNLLTIDIGNTRIHWGLFVENECKQVGDFLTQCITEDELAAFLSTISSTGDTGTLKVAACSVVPQFNTKLQKAADRHNIGCRFLTSTNCPALKISYPTPSEIGPDRLANAIGGYLHATAPFVVVDMGTAVTLDIITGKNGYEGGVIAPGFALLSDYLPEKTALLPKIDLDKVRTRKGIGKSTREAMELGCTLGFVGMIRESVANARDAILTIDEKEPELLVTGGTYRWFAETWIGTLPYFPHLTLEGLHQWHHQK